METMEQRVPEARDERLVVQELPDELLVYDLDRHRAHSLNRTAAFVWRHCDGRRSVADMTALLQRELDLPPDEEVVWLALQRLQRVHLLQERITRPAAPMSTSRRELVKRLAMAGGLALVTSIVAPGAAEAATLVSAGGPCVCDANCRTNHCCSIIGSTSPGVCTQSCGNGPLPQGCPTGYACSNHGC
jgi:hypothetical protein